MRYHHRQMPNQHPHTDDSPTGETTPRASESLAYRRALLAGSFALDCTQPDCTFAGAVASDAEALAAKLAHESATDHTVRVTLTDDAGQAQPQPQDAPGGAR